MVLFKTAHSAYLSEALPYQEDICFPVHFIFEDGTEIIENRTKNLYNRNGRLPKRTRERIMNNNSFAIGTIPIDVDYLDHYIRIRVRNIR